MEVPFDPVAVESKQIRKQSYFFQFSLLFLILVGGEKLNLGENVVVEDKYAFQV